MAPIMPLGTSLAGSFASSAANGTPSTAKNNHIAKGKAAHTPYQPKGKNSFAPAASVTATLLAQAYEQAYNLLQIL